MADIQTQLPVRITDGTNQVGITASGPSLMVDLSNSASNTNPFATNLTQVGGSAVSLGQTTMTSSIPVTIASDQTDLGVNIDKYGGTSTTLGTKVAASSIPVTMASDQPDIGVNIDKYGGTTTTLGQKTMANSIPVVLASDYVLAVTTGETTTGIVAYYNTATSVANNSTGTITYTVTGGTTLYLKQVICSASGGPTKVVVDYGAGPTRVCVGFTSTANPNYVVTFGQPVAITAGTAVNVKITNQAGAAQDVYATILGHEI